MSTAETLPNVRVGVGVITKNAKGQILLGKRKGSHGEGSWEFPGGHLDHGEEVVDCAYREVMEETGLKVRNGKIVAVANSIFKAERKHYITLFVRVHLVPDADGQEPEPQTLEPHASKGWVWKTGDEVRAMRDSGETLFLPISDLFKEHERIEDL